MFMQLFGRFWWFMMFKGMWSVRLTIRQYRLKNYEINVFFSSRKQTVNLTANLSWLKLCLVILWQNTTCHLLLLIILLSCILNFFLTVKLHENKVYVLTLIVDSVQVIYLGWICRSRTISPSAIISEGEISLTEGSEVSRYGVLDISFPKQSINFTM